MNPGINVLNFPNSQLLTVRLEGDDGGGFDCFGAAVFSDAAVVTSSFVVHTVDNEHSYGCGRSNDWHVGVLNSCFNIPCHFSLNEGSIVLKTFTFSLL